MVHFLADHLTRAGRTEARVTRTRAFYQSTVQLQLGALTDDERITLGKCMYLAQMATIEARYNPEGSRQFRGRAETCLRCARAVKPPMEV